MDNHEGDRTSTPAAALVFRTRVRQRAQELGLKDADVAHRLQIKPQRYNNYVNGTRKPDLEILRKISAVLRITVDELIAPSWPLLNTDRDTRLATNELAEYLPDLTPAETGVLAKLALYLRSERRKEADALIRLPHQMHGVACVHERLIPSLIRTLQPRRVLTETDFDAGGLYMAIHLDFPLDHDRRQLERALRGLVAERLRGIPFELQEIMYNPLPDDLQARLVLKAVSRS